MSKSAVLIAGIATFWAVTSGGCSPSALKRGPASAGEGVHLPEQSARFSVNFTLIRERGVDSLVRVYRAMPFAKTTHIVVSNPGGAVSCHLGSPLGEIDGPPYQAEPYVREAPMIQDLVCFNSSTTESFVTVRVDYYAPTLDDLPPIRESVGELIALNSKVVDAYNHKVKEKLDRAAQEREHVFASRFFADKLVLNYAGGPHTFSVVPIRRTTSSGGVEEHAVTYVIRGGRTPYYPEDPAYPAYWENENAFAPVFSIPSNERWDEAAHGEWISVVCPNERDALGEYLSQVAARARTGAGFPTRKDLWEKIGRHAVPRAEDCEPDWFSANILGNKPSFIPVRFERQDKYRFCYRKRAQDIQTDKGLVSMTAYLPDRIEAVYSNLSQATISKPFGRSENDLRGPKQGHPFFEGRKLTQILSSDSGKLPAEVCVPTRSAQGPLDAEKVVVGFSLPRQ